MARSFATWAGASLSIAFGAALIAGCGKGDAPAAANQFQPADAPAASIAADTPGNGAANSEVADGTPAKPVAKPMAKTVGQLDEEGMPEGPPEAILAYMSKLESHQPRGVTQDQRRNDYIRVMRLLAEAADRVLQHEQSTPEDQLDAATRKLVALNEMTKHGEPKASQERLAFSRLLAKSNEANLSRLGEVMLLNISIEDFAKGDSEETKPIVDKLKALLATEDKDHVAFMLGQQAMEIFVSLGHHKQGREIGRLLGERYQNDKDPKIAATANELLKQEHLLSLGYAEKMRALLSDKPDPTAAADVVKIVDKFISDSPGDSELGIARQTIDILERVDHFEAATQVCDLVEAKFASAPSEEVAEEAARIVKNARIRGQLIGKRLPITGRTLDGQPFDASQLRGKVVLVDFWATWCPACLQEMPNIAKYYELYKDKGFEVIGYSLDKPEDLATFFANQAEPWPILLSEDDNRMDFLSPLAQKCGVGALPQVVLLDQQGKVVALHLSGDKLGEKLAELLGPAEEQAERPASRVSRRPARPAAEE